MALGLLAQLIEADPGGQFDQLERRAARRAGEHGEIGNHHVDDALAGQRQGAGFLELGLARFAVRLDQQIDDALDAGDQIDRQAMALTRHLAVSSSWRRSPFSATSMAPRMLRSIWPPRIIAKLSALEK